MRVKLYWIKRLKYYFFRFGIHHILPEHKLNFLSHLSALSKWIHAQKNMKFSSFPDSVFDYSRRFDLYQFIIENELGEAAIDYLEFGVSKGVSFKWWVEKVKNPKAKFYGFDTFTGLPEDWGPFKKGAMSSGNALPEIDDTRYEFFQGLFQDTLYRFLKNYDSDKRKIVHLDADLYTATLFVLTTMSPYLKKGDIIIFDEFNVPLHEFKAFREWADSFYINYSVIGEVNNFFEVAIILE